VFLSPKPLRLELISISCSAILPSKSIGNRNQNNRLTSKSGEASFYDICVGNNAFEYVGLRAWSAYFRGVANMNFYK